MTATLPLRNSGLLTDGRRQRARSGRTFAVDQPRPRLGSAAPFGGVKESGLGREGGPEGLLEYTEPKYLAVSW